MSDPIDGRELLAIRARCARTAQGNPQSRRQTEIDRENLMFEVYRLRDELAGHVGCRADLSIGNALRLMRGEDSPAERLSSPSGSPLCPETPQRLRRAQMADICDVCGLPDPYNGQGDGVGSCGCPTCDGGEAAAGSVFCTCPDDDGPACWVEAPGGGVRCGLDVDHEGDHHLNIWNPLEVSGEAREGSQR